MLNSLLREKGSSLSYVRTLRSVVSSLNEYSFKPNPELWVSKTEEELTVISSEIAKKRIRKYPRASVLSRMVYPFQGPKNIKMLHKAEHLKECYAAYLILAGEGTAGVPIGYPFIGSVTNNPAPRKPIAIAPIISRPQIRTSMVFEGTIRA